MRRKMLKKLARFLAHDVKDDWFYMGNWASAGFKEKKCGTTACALGWATACFPRSALKLFRGEGCENSSYDILYKDHNGIEHTDYEAAEAFFQISYGEARWLFAPDEYQRHPANRFEVAARLLKVADKKVERV